MIKGFKVMGPTLIHLFVFAFFFSLSLSLSLSLSPSFLKAHLQSSKILRNLRFKSDGGRWLLCLCEVDPVFRYKSQLGSKFTWGLESFESSSKMLSLLFLSPLIVTCRPNFFLKELCFYFSFNIFITNFKG